MHTVRQNYGYILIRQLLHVSVHHLQASRLFSKLPCTHSDQLALPVKVHKAIYYISHIDEFMTVLLHTGDGKMIKRLFYASVQAQMPVPVAARSKE